MRKPQTIFGRNTAPIESTVHRLMTKFATAGSVLTVKLPGWKRSCRTEKQLVIAQDSVFLFLFLLARAAPAFLPTALSVALRPLFPFRQAQYVPVFPLKPAPFCTLFAGLGNTIKSAIFLLFFSCLTLVLSSPPCPLLHLSCYLKLCGRSGRNCPSSPPVLSGYNGSPDTRFSRGTTQLMSLPDGERCLRPPQSLVVSLPLSLVSTFVLSRTGGALSLQSILTHRFLQFPLRNLGSLVMLAVSSLVFAAMDTAFF